MTALERAAKLVSVEKDGLSWRLRVLSESGAAVPADQYFGDEQAAHSVAEQFLTPIVAALEAHAEEAVAGVLREGMRDAPALPASLGPHLENARHNTKMSHLPEIKDWCKGYVVDVEALLAVIDHQTKLIAALARDSDAYQEGKRAGWAEVIEVVTRLCVRRSCTWTKAEDELPQAYREGIEDACGQLVLALREMHLRSSTAPESALARHSATLAFPVAR